MGLTPIYPESSKQLIALVGESPSLRNIISIFTRPGIIRDQYRIAFMVCPFNDQEKIKNHMDFNIPLTTRCNDLSKSDDIDLVIVLDRIPGLKSTLNRLMDQRIQILTFTDAPPDALSSCMATELEKRIIQKKIGDETVPRQELLTLFDLFSEKISHLQSFNGTCVCEKNKLPVTDSADTRQNQALGKKRKQGLIHTARLTHMGTMAASMAHEIIQPLNVIKVCGELVQKMMKKGMDIPADDLWEMVSDIVDNANKASDIAGHINYFSRKPGTQFQRMDLNAPIRGALKMTGHYLQQHGITPVVTLDETIRPILGSENRLEQVFVNLIINAVQAMDEKDRVSDTLVEKTLRVSTTAEKESISVRVADTGTGMSPEVKKRLFTPFFTTKPQGTGLGTSITLEILKEHKGVIEVTSVPGQGSDFTIFFPALF